MADFNVPLIYEEVTVTERVAFTEMIVSVYDAVAVVEYASLEQQPWALAQNMPVWTGYAEFSKTFQGDLKAPAWKGSGQFGYSLDKEMPTRSLAGTMQADSIGMTVSSYLPTWSLAGQTGFQLYESNPVWGLSASFVMSYILTLSVRIPLRTVTATMYTEGVFQLDQTMPVRSLTASMGVTADVMSVASKIPGALLLAGSMYEGDAFQLDAIIPQRTMAGAMWSDVWWLNEEIPVWLIDSLMLDTKPSVHPDSDITEDSFSGVLRYVRP